MLRSSALLSLCVGLAAAATCRLHTPPLRLGGAQNLVLINGTAGSSVKQRQLWLVTPAVMRNATTLLALHGTGFFAADFLRSTGWDEVGPEHGYVVVAPDGLPERLPFTNIYHGGSWQLGNAKGDGREDIYRVDDKAFVADALACVASLLPPGALNRRVMLAGWSNGGKLAARLGCEGIPGWRAMAVAAASGMQLDAGQRCANGPPPLVLFQGSSDSVVPYCKKAPYGPVAFEPTQPEFARWSGGNASLVATMCEGKTTQYEYSAAPGAGAPATNLLWIEGGAHAWPASIDGCGSATQVALALFAAVGAGQQPKLCPAMHPCAASSPC